jgi:hypothetical protein
MNMVSRRARSRVLSEDSREKLRKLLKDAAGDLLTEQAMATQFDQCREVITALLYRYEASAERQATDASFTTWLVHHEGRNDPVGDFADDWLSDDATTEPASLKELITYLECRGATPEAIEAGREAWRKYSASKQAR